MKETANEPETFYPQSKRQWRNWLQKHHARKQSVWLIYYKKASGMKSISWSDAVDEALCFGWVDSKKKTIDENTYMQFFSKRKTAGTWSKINKEKIEHLTEKGLMTVAGLDCIAAAKLNGSWNILDDVEDLAIPKDLDEGLKALPGAETYFGNVSKSSRKAMLQWLVLAKRPETRAKRIAEIATLAAQQKKPKPF